MTVRSGLRLGSKSPKTPLARRIDMPPSSRVAVVRHPRSDRPRRSRSRTRHSATADRNDDAAQAMDRGEHAVQFPALINMMSNDDGDRSKVVSHPERDVSVRSALEAGRAMEMSPVRLSGFRCGLRESLRTGLQTALPHARPRHRPGDEPRPMAPTRRRTAYAANLATGRSPGTGASSGSGRRAPSAAALIPRWIPHIRTLRQRRCGPTPILP